MSMTRMVKEQGGLHQINDEDFHTYLPKGKIAIGLKWVFRNKKDERGIVIRNRARFVAQGHTQEEGIDYDEVFAIVARIEAIWNRARFVAQGHTQEEGIDYDEVFAIVARIEAIWSQVNAVEGIIINNSIDGLNHLRLQISSRETDQTLNPTSNFLLLITIHKHNGISNVRCTHNMVALLSKSDASEYFDQIVDFLNAHTINAKRTAWNKFSCSMTSAIICLATGRKFNFSKYIFDNMVRNVDSPSKFLMDPRFLQVVMDKQVDDMTTNNTRYTSPTITQKVVAMDAESQERLNQEEVSAAEPIVFDDEDVTMTMA
uniref:Copia protein n=1 Tax=Tanacetum cinerariifolium TaxID=118510 RepID=A0A6L2NKJ8_TANCI|nr:copia protein [Tanacetum cinerariifolium]